MPTVYSPAERQGFIDQAIAAGVSSADIQNFLAFNPGDENRIIDAMLGVRREDYTAANPQTAPVLQPRAPSGEIIEPQRNDASIYGVYQRSVGLSPSNATSGPPGPAGYASFPELSGYTRPGGGASILGFDPMTLLLLAGAAYLAWRLLK